MKRTRKHGFEPPFHPFQVIGWICTLAMLLINYVLIRGALGLIEEVSSKQYLFLILYSGLELAVLVFAFILTKGDPTDPVVYAHKAALQRK